MKPSIVVTVNQSLMQLKYTSVSVAQGSLNPQSYTLVDKECDPWTNDVFERISHFILDMWLMYIMNEII